jgi:hypothetical protein
VFFNVPDYINQASQAQVRQAQQDLSSSQLYQTQFHDWQQLQDEHRREELLRALGAQALINATQTSQRR